MKICMTMFVINGETRETVIMSDYAIKIEY